MGYAEKAEMIIRADGIVSIYSLNGLGQYEVVDELRYRNAGEQNQAPVMLI